MDFEFAGQTYSDVLRIKGDPGEPWWFVKADEMYLVQCAEPEHVDEILQIDEYFISNIPVRVCETALEVNVEDYQVVGDVLYYKDRKYDLSLPGDETVSLFEYLDKIIVVAQDIGVRVWIFWSSGRIAVSCNSLKGYSALEYANKYLELCNENHEEM
jgi:hypothetical protein